MIPRRKVCPSCGYYNNHNSWRHHVCEAQASFRKPPKIWTRRPKRSLRQERPGTTPRMPKNWRQTCAKIRRRDQATCRRCGTPSVLGHVDHVIPRRLLAPGRLSTLTVLAWLCPPCHAYKTFVVEPALYQGDVLTFRGFYNLIATTGPVPASGLLAGAYKRLRDLIVSEVSAPTTTRKDSRP